MTALLTVPQVDSTRTLTRGAGAGSPWLVSPAFDLLFVANLGWPLLVAALLAWGPELQSGVSFWQIYFVTTPHRWITLALVFLDRDRLRERPLAFATVGCVVVVGCLAWKAQAGGLTCLLLIDYLWNAWHFASQHSGILRLYSRQARPRQPGSAFVEKLLVRTFALYVLVRVSGLAWPLLGAPLSSADTLRDDPFRFEFEAALQVADWLILIVPAAMIWTARSSFSRLERGRGLYLASFLALYLSLLGAAHAGRTDVVLLLMVVLALFHATEYLAVVTWTVQRRKEPRRLVETRGRGGRNLLAAVAPHWGLALAVFCGALGIAGWLSDRVAIESWLTANVVVSFLHYAYDGMIWKQRRRPQVNVP